MRYFRLFMPLLVVVLCMATLCLVGMVVGWWYTHLGQWPTAGEIKDAIVESVKETVR
jgi:hypothetical protein